VIPLRAPAWAFLGFWFVMQLYAGNFTLIRPDTNGGGGVAFFAHVGGFIFGALVAIVLTRAGRITSRSTTDTSPAPTATGGAGDRQPNQRGGPKAARPPTPA
jgi:membrane associated rhomboid family serine protease